MSRAQRDRVVGYIRKGVEEGAQLVTGGPEAPLPQGFYVAPTVFGGVTPEMTIAQEEIFGPVLSVMPYADEDDHTRVLRDLTAAGRPLVLQYRNGAEKVAATCVVSPALLAFLNNKGSLAELVPDELLPERRVVAPEVLSDGRALLERGTVVVKAASDLPSWTSCRTRDGSPSPASP